MSSGTISLLHYEAATVKPNGAPGSTLGKADLKS